MCNCVCVRQVALLQWLSSQTDEDRRQLMALTGIQVAREVLNRVTGQDQVDAYKVSDPRSDSVGMDGSFRCHKAASHTKYRNMWL